MWITGDSVEWMKKQPDGAFDLVLGDPPYSEFPLINDAAEQAFRLSKYGVLFFMYAEDIWHLDMKPDQVLFWTKPVSTKNTSRRYSRFVEVICTWGTGLTMRNVHWSTRTGIFTDTLALNPAHMYGKPESLIEKLLLNHAPDNAHVLDPFAGSGTVEKVCNKLGLQCTSIEIDPKWTPK